MNKLALLILFIIFFKLILNLIAGLLYGILNIFNSLIVAFKYRKKEGFIRQWNEYNLDSAFNIDVYAQYNLRSLWNLLFSWGGGYQFGTQILETISSVLGRKQIEKSLSWMGWFWVYFLYVIDYKNWKNGGHCLNAYKHYLKQNK